MGMMTESAILKEQRRTRDEANARLDQLIAEQRRTNELLAALLQTRRDGPRPAGVTGEHGPSSGLRG